MGRLLIKKTVIVSAIIFRQIFKADSKRMWYYKGISRLARVTPPLADPVLNHAELAVLSNSQRSFGVPIELNQFLSGSNAQHQQQALSEWNSSYPSLNFQESTCLA